MKKRQMRRLPASLPDDTDIPKPQSVKNFTCLDKFFNGAGLNVVINLLNSDDSLERHREPDLQQA